MDCPNCKTHLKVKNAISKPYSIHVWECLICAGWWFGGNDLEEYRASILSTNQYTVLPEFRLISEQSPAQCCCCEQNSLRLYDTGSHVIQQCSECSGTFLSKKQVLEMVKKEDDMALNILGDLGGDGILALIFGILSIFFK